MHRTPSDERAARGVEEGLGENESGVRPDGRCVERASRRQEGQPAGRVGDTALLEQTHELILDDIGQRADDDELHWWNNLCAGIESLATAALAQRGRTRIGNTVIAALSSLRGRIWTAGTEREFAERRAQGIRADMQLEISSCTTPEQIVATLGRWMSHLQPRRAFLVRFAAPCTEPPERATLLQVYLDGVAQPGRPLDFATRLLLPDPLAVELERGTLLLNPLYAGAGLSFVPIDYYVKQALDLMWAHLSDGVELPPSQVVPARAPDGALVAADLPPISPSPEAAIVHADGALVVPD